MQKLKEDIENDPIIRDQKGNLGYLLGSMSDGFLSSFLVAWHTFNDLSFRNDKRFQDECYKIDKI